MDPSFTLIIGNAPLEQDYRALCDQAEYVVRFNRCRGFGENTGERCHELWLANIGKDGDFFAHDDSMTAIYRRPELKQLCFANPAKPDWLNTLIRFRYRHKHIDHSRAILANSSLTVSQVRYMDQAFRQSTLKHLYQFGRPDYRPYGVSSGTLAVADLMRRQHPYPIKMIGFRFQGWKRHPWALEQAYIESLQQQGKLELIFE